MLQDVIDHIKTVASEKVGIKITDNTPQQKDMQITDKPLYVITTETDEATTDMCSHTYHTSQIKVKGATAVFNLNDDTTFKESGDLVQANVDKLGQILLESTRKAPVTVSDDTHLIQVNNYTTLPIGVDPAGRHVYELTMVTLWLSTAQ